MITVQDVIASLRARSEQAEELNPRGFEVMLLRAELRILLDEIERLRELEAAVKKYAECKSKAEGLPTDWAAVQAKWQEVVQQTTQLAAEAAGGE